MNQAPAFTDIERLEQKRSQAIGYFKQRYPAENAEDFGSWCVIEYLSGRRPIRTKMIWMAADYLRKYGVRLSGQDTTPVKAKPLPPKKRRGSIDFMNQMGRLSTDFEGSELDTYPSNSDQVKLFHDSELLRSKNLLPQERAILLLFYKWGLTEKEIGDLFGVSESRISQLKRQGENVIKKLV